MVAMYASEPAATGSPETSRFHSLSAGKMPEPTGAGGPRSAPARSKSLGSSPPQAAHKERATSHGARIMGATISSPRAPAGRPYSKDSAKARRRFEATPHFSFFH